MDEQDCRRLLADLPAYAEGEVSAALGAEIERHLADCERCRLVIDTLRQTAKLYHRAPQPPFPAEARERLYKALGLNPFVKP